MPRPARCRGFDEGEEVPRIGESRATSVSAVPARPDAAGFATSVLRFFGVSSDIEMNSLCEPPSSTSVRRAVRQAGGDSHSPLPKRKIREWAVCVRQPPYSVRRRSMTRYMSGSIAMCSMASRESPETTPSHSSGNSTMAGTNIAPAISRVLTQP
jgi:hypothetical protein